MKIFTFLVFLILVPALSLAQTYTITNVSWTQQVDDDGDGYTQSRLINITVNASSNTSAIFEIRAWLDGQSESLYGNTTSFAVLAGTFTYTVPIGYGSNIGGELNHGTFDFRVLLRTGINGTILAQRGPSDDNDLNNENFETAAQDISQTYTIDNVSWTDQVDQDGDTFTRSRTMNITITASQLTGGLTLEFRAWPDGQAEALYCSISTSVFGGTFTYTAPIGTNSTCGAELSHNTYDFRVLLKQGSTILAQRGPNDDGDLNNENFETSAEDLPQTYTITDVTWTQQVDDDQDGYTQSQLNEYYCKRQCQYFCYF